jgi:hypothetical protein
MTSIPSPSVSSALLGGPVVPGIGQDDELEKTTRTKVASGSGEKKPPNLVAASYDDASGGSGKNTKFDEVNRKFTKITFGAIAAIAVPTLFAAFRGGAEIPSKALRFFGDLFGSVGALAAPFFMGGNEKLNNSKLESGNGGNLFGMSSDYFDSIRDGFYRCCSLGFTPYIFEQFIDPKTWNKSVFHTAANIINLPNLAFTGYTWGYGNFKSLIAWGMRTQKEIERSSILEPHTHDKAKNPNDQVKLDNLNADIHGLNTIYNSNKRMATIGSIANPTLQGLNQCADSLAYITGKMDGADFWDNPFHGVSRIVSLFVGIPETVAKMVDSANRVLVKERIHLKEALPKRAYETIESLGEKLKDEFNPNGSLYKLKDVSEMIFHTLSPLSMFALFTPLLGKPSTDEDAQARGGLNAVLDSFIGKTGKFLTYIITGTYVAVGRLPQSIFQAIYFGRKIYGEKVKGETKEQTNKALGELKNSLLNNSFISGVSGAAKSVIKKLIPDFYSAQEKEHGFLSYEQIEAKYGFDQIESTYEKEFKTVKLNKEKLDENRLNEIVSVAMDFVEKNALSGKHDLSESEKSEISKLIGEKILNSCASDNHPSPIKREVKIPFIGADYLARFLFRGFDLRSRLDSINWTSDHHVKETAYTNDELWNFDAELSPVILECLTGFRNTINRAFTFFRLFSFS